MRRMVEAIERLSPEERRRIREGVATRVKPPEPPDWRGEKVADFTPAEPAKKLRVPAISDELSRAILLGPDAWGRAVRVKQPFTRSEVRTTQSLLREFGWYEGAVDGIPGPLTAKAIQAFNEKTSTTATGDLTRATYDELLLEGVKFYDRLDPAAQAAVDARIATFVVSVGFGKGRPPVAALKEYQRFVGMPETGRPGPELWPAIVADRRLHSDLVMIELVRLFGGTPESSLRRVGSRFFAFATDGSYRYLLANRDAPELWFVDALGTVIGRQKTNAIGEFYTRQRALAANTTTDRLVFVHASPESGEAFSPIVVQVGSRTVTVPRDRFEAFIESSAQLDTFEELLGPAASKARRPMIAVLQNGMFSESSTSSDAKMFSATAQAAAIKARYDGGVEVFMATDAGSARDNAR
jgi:peptidoglycan hydrolase-like protein with peptidoglycan-binding domain